MKGLLTIVSLVFAVACSMERCGCYPLEVVSLVLKSAAFASLAMIVSYVYDRT